MTFRFEIPRDGESPKSLPTTASHKDTGPAIDRLEATLRNKVEFHPVPRSSRPRLRRTFGSAARSVRTPDPTDVSQLPASFAFGRTGQGTSAPQVGGNAMSWPPEGDVPVTAIPLVGLAGNPAQDKSKRFRRVVNQSAEDPERPIRISLPHTHVRDPRPNIAQRETQVLHTHESRANLRNLHGVAL